MAKPTSSEVRKDLDRRKEARPAVIIDEVSLNLAKSWNFLRIVDASNHGMRLVSSSKIEATTLYLAIGEQKLEAKVVWCKKTESYFHYGVTFKNEIKFLDILRNQGVKLRT